MLLVGSDDGVYRIARASGSRTARVRKQLHSGRVHRLRRLDGVEGVFAATEDGLFHSTDGREWHSLNVPQEAVYAVGADAASGRLYAGTRPAHVYASEAVDGDGRVRADPSWTELTEVQRLPSRAEWRLPRHDDLAQVRDVRHDGERLVLGVEVGGVVVDTGDGLRECGGVDDDVHELHVVGPGEYAAATGSGLYHTTDAGATWTRLDGGHDQRYFRRAYSLGDTLYAAGALSNSATWNDTDADPALFAFELADGEGSADGTDRATLAHLPLPRDDETVTGMTALDGSLVVATHTGSLFWRVDDDWRELPSFPVVDGELTGRYTPVTVTR